MGAKVRHSAIKQKNENDSNDRYEDTRNGGGILGKVIFPEVRGNSPRELTGVPRGHYPPPGSCRVWYPNRPPGHQPPPTGCDNLRGMRLEPGAFILHGDRAYDAEYGGCCGTDEEHVLEIAKKVRGL